MERCRSQLNRELISRLSTDVTSQAVIVYDAFESYSDVNRRQLLDGLVILYAPKGTDADSEIERLLLKHSVPKRVLVVSSDHRLHKAAARRRARCVDSEEFWTQLTADSEAQPHSPFIRPPEPLRKTDDPGDDIVEELQRFAENAVRSQELEIVEEAGADVFDDDYLRKLAADLRNDRLR